MTILPKKMPNDLLAAIITQIIALEAANIVAGVKARKDGA